MPQSLSVVYLHCVFSTKDRVPFQKDPAVRADIHSELAGISNRLDCPVRIVGGVEDHVHILFRQGRKISQSDWVMEVKRASSLWIKTRDPRLSSFHWQSGFGMFSVDATDFEREYRYIENQEEHHRRYTFKEEFIQLLKDHGMDWEIPYLWD